MFQQDSAKLKKAFQKREDITSDLWLRDACAEHECSRWNSRKEHRVILSIRHLL
jgi:hypothetical protein